MFQYCGVSYHRLWNYPPQRTTMAPAGGLNLTWPLPLFCLKCLHWQFDFEGSKQTTRHSVCVLQTFPSFDNVKIKLQSQTLQKLFMLYQTENAFWGNFRISKWYMKKINWSSHIFHWFVYFFISHGLRTVSFTKSWARGGYSAWKLMGVCRWPLKIGPKKIEEKIEFGAKKIDFCKNW